MQIILGGCLEASGLSLSMRLSWGKNIDKNNDTVGRQFAARIALLSNIVWSQMEENMGNSLVIVIIRAQTWQQDDNKERLSTFTK